MSAVKILRQVRSTLAAAVVSSSPARISYSGRPNRLYTFLTNHYGVKHQMHFRLPRHDHHQLFDLHKFTRFAKKFCVSGQRLGYGSMVVFALLGSRSFTPQNAYCENDHHMLSSQPRTPPSEASRIEENLLRAFLLMRKMIVPVFLFLTVWLNWGLSHPVFLTAKVVLIFLSTKPFPSSVHMFVEQLRRQISSRNPLLYRFTPLQVKSVQVEDYMLLCLAKVVIKDENLVLMGILGSWWILPLSSWREVFLFNATSWRQLFSVIKSRFRLDVEASCC